MPTFCLVFLILFILSLTILGGLYLRKMSKKSKKVSPQKPVDINVIKSSVSVSGSLKSKPIVQEARIPTRSPSVGSSVSSSRHTGLSNHTHHNTSNDHMMAGLVVGSALSSNSHRDDDRCSGGYSSPTPSYSSDSGSDSGSSSCSGGSYD